MPILVNLESYLTNIKNRSTNPDYQRDFAAASLKELYKRFPKCGAEVSAYVSANILHPYFRGNLVKNYSNWKDLFQKFIFENQSEVEEVSQDLQTARATAAVPDDKEDEFWASADLMSKRWQATPTENLSQTGVAEGPTTPLKTELDIYMKLPFPNSSKLDILAWWNGQKVKCLVLLQNNLSTIEKFYLKCFYIFRKHCPSWQVWLGNTCAVLPPQPQVKGYFQLVEELSPTKGLSLTLIMWTCWSTSTRILQE